MKNASGQDKVGKLSDREKLVKNASRQGKVGELRQIKIKWGKSRGIQLKTPQVKEKSRNLMK